MSRRRQRDIATVQPSSVGHVYFFATADERFVKIGWTSDLPRRFKDIQASQPQPLIFLGALEGPRSDESGWHRYFRSQRAIGEWFALDDGLHWAIDFALKSPGVSYEVTVEQALTNARCGTRLRTELTPERVRAISASIRRHGLWMPPTAGGAA